MAGYYLLGFFFFLLAAIINQGTNDNSEITVVEKKKIARSLEDADSINYWVSGTKGRPEPQRRNANSPLASAPLQGPLKGAVSILSWPCLKAYSK